MAITANKKTKTPKKAKGAAANYSSANINKKKSAKPVKLAQTSAKKKGNPFAKKDDKAKGGKDAKAMSPKDRFKMMMEKKKKGGQKASITAKKPKKATGRKTKLSGTFASKAITPKKAKVVKHKKKGRI